ncbi:cytoskeleton protein RodZ [Vibrio mexicanus]|uniref:cytoskeleton protein RodZ n=1 Tax=Vibrio mexicanus TaxID=1004326 RepID=UPI00063CBC53|nr:cytoskeleton protein RodZ [Vibrio mexicanus]
MSTEQNTIVEESSPQSDSHESPKVEAGTLLKNKREELGYTQQQIADRLRLRISIIQNIESNQFENGQVATFTRGYLRSYAKAVNLDEEMVLCAFDDGCEPEVHGHNMKSFSKKTNQEKHDSRIMSLTWGIGAIIIGISAYWVWQNQQQDTLTFIDEQEVVQEVEAAPATAAFTDFNGDVVASDGDNESAQPVTLPELENTEPAEPVTLPEVETPEPVTLPEVEEQAEAPVPTQLPEVEAPVTEVVAAEPETVEATIANNVSMNFIADCWIQVKDATGKTLSTGIKKGGQTLDLTGEAPFSVILGAPENVSMTFGSEPVDLSGYTSGKVARFTLPRS